MVHIIIIFFFWSTCTLKKILKKAHKCTLLEVGDKCSRDFNLGKNRGLNFLSKKKCHITQCKRCLFIDLHFFKTHRLMSFGISKIG